MDNLRMRDFFYKVQKIVGIDEAYTIGYRFYNESDDLCKMSLDKFNFLDINKNYWFADPLFFEGYVFVEMFDRKKDKGSIGCLQVLPTGFGKPKVIIEENYHLSYPSVFRLGNNIYMIPETGSINELVIYECIDFPFKWNVKYKIPVDYILTDTNIIMIGNNVYLWTSSLDKRNSHKTSHRFFELHIKSDSAFVVERSDMLENVNQCSARNAGAIFVKEGRIYRPSQICTDKDYGKGIVFNCVRIGNQITEEAIGEINSDDYNKITGLHTYTRDVSAKIEIIDIRFNKWRPFLIFHILKRRLNCKK